MDYSSLFENKVVLITGGTGFLGQSLVDAILKYNPKSIRIFSRDEVKHYKMENKFQKYKDKLRFFIGDVRDYDRLNTALSNVDIAIHAAALKRLDLIEYNVEESIKTNVLGTLNFAKACLANNIEKGIFVSTDKACSPVNTYGACKFLSEKIMTNSNYSKGSKRTVLSTVRYGNVLESTGSVIPFFESKIIAKEEVPLTDDRMTRFFITPQQAVELVFDCIKYSVGGEIFIPKLPAFKITDLIELLKKKHASKVGVKVVGLRPGEKIHELMLNSYEIRNTYSFNNKFVICSEIENYIDLENVPDYIKTGKKIKESEMDEYSSEDSVVSQTELTDLFTKYNLI
ncbi:SDR family NAD(P)-dependent oxidoreductase [Candidatus Woesearchaeota archaeon]|nr:SDR family NAD(P)-dependent oxidoreductase [Candidatus Woesearchaeota archaeon]